MFHYWNGLGGSLVRFTSILERENHLHVGEMMCLLFYSWFSAYTVEQILENLQQDGSSFALEQLKVKYGSSVPGAWWILVTGKPPWGAPELRGGNRAHCSFFPELSGASGSSYAEPLPKSRHLVSLLDVRWQSEAVFKSCEHNREGFQWACFLSSNPPCLVGEIFRGIFIRRVVSWENSHLIIYCNCDIEL